MSMIDNHADRIQSISVDLEKGFELRSNSGETVHLEWSQIQGGAYPPSIGDYISVYRPGPSKPVEYYHELSRNGKYLEAIAEYRQDTGCTPEEAVEVVSPTAKYIPAVLLNYEAPDLETEADGYICDMAGQYGAIMLNDDGSVFAFTQEQLLAFTKANRQSTDTLTAIEVAKLKAEAK